LKEGVKAIRRLRIPINDNLKQNKALLPFLEPITAAIHAELTKGRKVLVHCYAGRQRSASIIAAYLIKYSGMTVLEAINYIRAKNRKAFDPIPNFIDTLVTWSELNLPISPPSTPLTDDDEDYTVSTCAQHSSPIKHYNRVSSV
jgi:protein-tyrosine phosphatase